MNELQAAQENYLAAKASGNAQWLVEAEAAMHTAEQVEASKFSELMNNPEIKQSVQQLDELTQMINQKGGDAELEKIRHDLKEDLVRRFGFAWNEKMATGGQVNANEEDENDFFPLL